MGRGEEWKYEYLPLSNNRGALAPKITDFLIYPKSLLYPCLSVPHNGK